jgi:hypothetical protein
LVEIEEVPLTAGSPFKAFWFQRASQPADTYVLIWAVRGEAELRLPVGAHCLTAMRPFGKAVPAQQDAGRTVLTVGNRHYLRFRSTSVEEMTRLLRD